MPAIEPDLVQTLHAVLAIVEGAGVRYALIGGLAKAAWGRARATHDVDLAVSLDANGFADLKARLVAAGFEVTNMVGDDLHPEIFVATKDGYSPVDVLVAATPFEQEALLRSVRTSLFDREISVVTAEDLVFFKLLAGRPHDYDDIYDVIHAQTAAGSFDWARLEQLAIDWGLEQELAKVRAQSD